MTDSDRAHPMTNPPRGPLRRMRLVLESIKFSHTLFALPFAALAAFWARGGWPRPGEAALLLVAMVAARTAAMSFNRVVDAPLDGHNPRTRARAIPAGALSAQAMASVTVVAAGVFIAAAGGFYLLSRNPWPGLLAVPVLAVLLGYSYTKRFTSLSHVVLGLALGLSPVGVWIALRGQLDWAPVTLGAAVVLWTAGFDILYSLQDLDHDREVGLRSIPAWLGAARAIMVSRGLHLMAITLLAAPWVLSRWDVVELGLRRPLGWWYAAGLACMTLLLVYEQTIVRPNDLSRLDRAFFTVNATGSVVLAVLGIADVLI